MEWNKLLEKIKENYDGNWDDVKNFIKHLPDLVLAIKEIKFKTIES